jgi:multiple sugar transport system permease protein
MFGLDLPVPDFWTVYFFIFWVLVGCTTAPVIFQHNGHRPLLGVLVGAVVGVLSAILFLLLLVALKPVADVLDRPFLGSLLELVASAAIVLVLLGFAKRLVPVAEGRESVGVEAEGGPRAPVTYSTRVDKVDPNWRSAQSIRASVAVMLTVLTLIPVAWMGMTAFKSYPDAVASPPKVVFHPTMEGIITLLTKRRQLLNDAEKAQYEQRTDLNWADKVMLKSGQAIIGQSEYVKRLKNSLIIAGSSTILSVTLGLLAAYAFSRFRIPGSGDLLFFILSTRMLPPVVVTIPIFLMYRELGWYDTYTGMIILYTAFNLSFSVWLLKGFIDEIPREYEEAALVDGYTRLQAFIRIVIPEAVTGIAATTVFCFIFAWNEYAFALMLTSEKARTAPPHIPSMIGSGLVEWAAIAAGSLFFLIPVVIVTFALRRYLLRGVTFGAIRQG